MLIRGKFCSEGKGPLQLCTMRKHYHPWNIILLADRQIKSNVQRNIVGLNVYQLIDK